MSLRLSPVEMRNRDIINDPALGDYQATGRAQSAETVEERRRRASEVVSREQWFGPFCYVMRPGDVVRLVQYTGDEATVRIPSEIDGHPVCELEPHLFAKHDEIEHVAVEETDSGRAPFFSTDGRALLTADGAMLVQLVVSGATYEVPQGCREIGDHAFDSLADLEHVMLPATLERIGRLSFAKTKLRSLELPASLRSIGEKAFYFCRDLTACDLPEGLVEIEAEAFVSSGLARVVLPAGLERMGERAFYGTPAQKVEGAAGISFGGKAGVYLDIDGEGGLYAHDVFVELLSCNAAYCVRPGTRRVAAGACRRNVTIGRIELPEGLVEIGDEAFRGCSMLVQATVPTSLEVIGDRAFVDTSLAELSLGPRVRHIGTSALLVQGEGQAHGAHPLARFSIDERNETFYVESGLLCERAGGANGGDVCLMYVGPENTVRIPDAVNRVAPFAFFAVRDVDELVVHGHMHSICRGAFDVDRAITRVRVDVTRYVEREGDSSERVWRVFSVPELSARYRHQSLLFDTDARGTVFNFDYYDSWVSHATDVARFAPAALARMTDPICLDDHMREIYLGIFERRSAAVCRYFARHGDLEALEALWRLGVLDEKCVEGELEWAFSAGQAQATACLLEVKRRHLGGTGIDFSL